MRDNLTPTVEKQRHPRLPIRYWECRDLAGNVLDTNNSVALLRHKWKWHRVVTFYAVR